MLPGLGLIHVLKLLWDLFFFQEGQKVSNILTVGKEIAVANEGCFFFFLLQLGYLNVLMASQNVLLLYISVFNDRNVYRKLIYFSGICF